MTADEFDERYPPRTFGNATVLRSAFRDINGNIAEDRGWCISIVLSPEEARAFTREQLDDALRYVDQQEGR